MKKGTLLSTALLTKLSWTLHYIFEPYHSGHCSIARTALESIDLHLQECIKQLQAGYAKNALSHCEISEQELDALLENTTAPTPG